MTLEILVVFALLSGVLVIFALELFPTDFVAFGIMALMLVIGPFLGVSSEAAISGFSNQATITVMAMFILSGALYRSGAVNLLARRVMRFAGSNEWWQLVLVMGISGIVSMFINNTAALAIFMPMVLTICKEHRRAPSKLLMPLSFAVQLGGVVTLIGTSTNVLASSLMEGAGLGGFGMFEFTAIGLLVFLTGLIYLLTLGRRLLPERHVEGEISKNYQLSDYLTDVIVLEHSHLVGKTLIESRLREQFDIDVLEIRRGGKRLGFLMSDQVLQAGDLLLVRAHREDLLKIKDQEGLAIESDPEQGNSKGTNNQDFLEVVIAPSSDLIGGTLETTGFRNRFNCTVIAMRKHGQVIRREMSKQRLAFGDTLLLQGEKKALNQIKRDSGFIVTEELQQEKFRNEKIPVALAIIAGVVLIAALEIAPILVTAVVGCVLMVLTGCLTVTELHESIRWDVIFLLAGVIPLGVALQVTGGAQFLADLVAQAAHLLPSFGVIWLFYVVAMLITAIISNNATVVVLLPVALATAETLGVDPKALALAIMFAASNDFSTPIGYQTNTMIYGPGGYKFLDFVRVGGPLNLILAVVTPLLIYLLWGL